MATYTSVPITWGGAAFKDVTSTTPVTSDPITFDPAALIGSLSVYAVLKTGAGALGDYVFCRLALNNGDVVTPAGDDFDTNEHAAPFINLYLYPGENPGENPAQSTREVPMMSKGFRLVVNCPSAVAGVKEFTVRAGFGYRS